MFSANNNKKPVTKQNINNNYYYDNFALFIYKSIQMKVEIPIFRSDFNKRLFHFEKWVLF